MTIFGSSASARAIAMRWRCPARELVRIAVDRRRREADQLQQPAHPLPAVRLTMDQQRLAHDRPTLCRGLSEPVRVLEDIWMSRRARFQPATGLGGDVVAFQQDLPGGRVHQAHHRATDGGLAAPAPLPDDAEHLAAARVKSTPSTARTVNASGVLVSA